MTRTTVSRQIDAPRSAVYRALLDAADVAHWMVPDDMRGEVSSFEPREGGRLRISLTYESPDAAGKTSAHTDSYHGHFVRLQADTEVVQRIAFETDDPRMRGEMTVTLRLADVDGGTRVTALHDGLPEGIAPQDNEVGWSMSLDKLARLVEARTPRR